MDSQDTFNEGYEFGKHLTLREGLQTEPLPGNPLEDYFDKHTTGPGLWKWRHYFDIYHRHFEKFVGREVHVVEIGVYSGGSLGMWKDYFGSRCRIYGVDMQPACRAYEDGPIRIFIGDQGDPAFWRDFVQQVPAIDIVIDDGGHRPYQQIVTLEALLPQIRPGGVYLCEDAHGPRTPFHDYINGLSRNLHSMGAGQSERMRRPSSEEVPRAVWRRRPTDFQRTVQSIHLYPFVIVIEKRSRPLDALSSSKNGTEWLPLLDRARSA